MLENGKSVAKADKSSIDEDGNTNTYSLAQFNHSNFKMVNL